MSYLFFLRSKRKPNQGVVILEEKQRGSMGSLALLGSLPRLGLLFNFEVCGLGFEPRLYSLTIALLLSGWAFSFPSFLFFFFYPDWVIYLLLLLSSLLPCRALLFYSFFAAWLGFLLLLLFGLGSPVTIY